VHFIVHGPPATRCYALSVTECAERPTAKQLPLNRRPRAPCQRSSRNKCAGGPTLLSPHSGCGATRTHRSLRRGQVRCEIRWRGAKDATEQDTASFQLTKGDAARHHVGITPEFSGRPPTHWNVHFIDHGPLQRDVRPQHVSAPQCSSRQVRGTTSSLPRRPRSPRRPPAYHRHPARF
jgi:hypothetical protein